MKNVLKGKVLNMDEYEINKHTLAIIPISETKSRVIEKENELIINLPTLKIIDDSCRFFGSSYEGRFIGTKNLTGISYKSPIIIEETKKIIFFPTKSPRISTCAWISFNNVVNYEPIENEVIIKFYGGKTLNLNISYLTIDNQILRSTRLESILTKRIENFSKKV